MPAGMLRNTSAGTGVMLFGPKRAGKSQIDPEILKHIADLERAGDAKPAPRRKPRAQRFNGPFQGRSSEQ
jgi:hypothetical protein